MSVRKRTWVSKGIEKTAWVVDYVDSDGNRRLKTHKLKKDADEFSKRAGVEVMDGVHVADSATITISEAGKLWLKSGAAAGLERTTLDQRRQHLDLHITPFIGTTKLTKVTAPFVRTFQDKLRDEARSPAMIKRVTVSLGSILADAQSRGLVVRNAVHELSRARTGTKSQERRGKARLQVGVDIPTNDEIRQILTAAEGRYRPALIAMIFTGLRSSELRALLWEDIDFKKGVATIRRRVDRYGDIGMPKSEAGQRSVPLPPIVVNTLKEWKLACPKSDLGLAFPNGAGNIEPHNNMLHRGLWPTQIAAGVIVQPPPVDEQGQPVPAPKYSGFHALRHWYASWCINRKAEGGLELSPKQVQARMGHSSIQVTFDTYGHLFPAHNEGKEMEAAANALFSTNAT